MSTTMYDTLTAGELAIAGEPPSLAEQQAWSDEQVLLSKSRQGLMSVYQHGSDWLGSRAVDRLAYGRDVRTALSNAGLRLKSRKVLPLMALFRSVKPHLVLELGAGGSTYFLAALLAENEKRYGVKGRLVSLEQAPDFFEQVRSSMPASLAPLCELRLCQVRLDRIGDYRAIFYDTPYDFGTVDIAYVDGPAPVRAGGKPLNHPIFSGDLVRMVSGGVRVRNAITDVRWLNHLFFRATLQNTHDVKASLARAGVLVAERI